MPQAATSLWPKIKRARIPGGQFFSSGEGMALEKAKNRRRQETAQRKAEISAAMKRRGLAFVRVVAALAIGAVIVFGGLRAWKWALTSPTFALDRITFR